MKSIGSFLRTHSWPQIGALALAGAGAFAIGMMLTGPGRGASEPDTVVVASPVRARTSGVDAGARTAPAQVPDVATPLESATDRLSEHVTYNPFAALNLTSPVPAASAAKVPPKKKPEPPPRTSKDEQ